MGGAASDTLAPGVVHHAIPTGPDSGIDLVDVDLARARVRLAVATDSLARQQGQLAGRPHTPQEWLERTHALAAVNGGYFGQPAPAGRVQIVGLLVQRGQVRQPAGRIRAALGIDARGVPSIAWARADGKALMACPAPARASGPGRVWNVQAAVGCGPMLIHDGQGVVTDRQEALVSPGALPRTFVAIDRQQGRPRHVVMGIASGSEYRDLAHFLQAYFPRVDGTRAQAAMCVDGGASTQLTYRTADGTLHSPRFTGVPVPDAVLVLPR